MYTAVLAIALAASPTGIDQCSARAGCSASRGASCASSARVVVQVAPRASCSAAVQASGCSVSARGGVLGGRVAAHRQAFQAHQATYHAVRADHHAAKHDAQAVRSGLRTGTLQLVPAPQLDASKKK